MKWQKRRNKELRAEDLLLHAGDLWQKAEVLLPRAEVLWWKAEDLLL